MELDEWILNATSFDDLKTSLKEMSSAHDVLMKLTSDLFDNSDGNVPWDDDKFWDLIVKGESDDAYDLLKEHIEEKVESIKKGE